MKVTLFLCSLILSSPLFSQKSIKYKNSIYPEIGGSGIYWSINYERLIYKGIAIRAGAGSAQKTLTSPILAGNIFGNGRHHFLLMGGITFIHLKNNQSSLQEFIDNKPICPTAFIGYRYQMPGDRLLFHTGYSPILRESLSHSVGVACGLRF
jgi:hypothetical protein